MRYLFGLLFVAAAVGLSWIISLPNKAECVASGRIVDPTQRHCETAAGFEQLEEHAMFHGTQIALGVMLLVAVGLGVRWLLRRRSMSPTPVA